MVLYMLFRQDKQLNHLLLVTFALFHHLVFCLLLGSMFWLVLWTQKLCLNYMLLQLKALLMMCLRKQDPTVRIRLWGLGERCWCWWWSWCCWWVSGDMKERQARCKNNIVWREYDKNIFFIWSNGSKKLFHGGNGFTFPVINATFKTVEFECIHPKF